MDSSEQTRHERLDALCQLSRLHPQWRLGQTVANLAMTAGRLDAGGVWDLEDAEALSEARADRSVYRDRLAGRQTSRCF